MKRLIFSVLMFTWTFAVQAQCAMCKATVENGIGENSEEVAKGLNSGILILMTMPYIILAGIVGLIVYNYKKKQKALVAEQL
jgi:hypothetical protein